MKLSNAMLCASCDSIVDIADHYDACPSCLSTCMIPLSSLIEPVSSPEDIAINRIVEKSR